MLELTEIVKDILSAAQKLGKDNKNVQLDPLHIFCVMLRDNELTGRVFGQVSGDKTALKHCIETEVASLAKQTPPPDLLLPNHGCSAVIETMDVLRNNLSDTHVSVDHLLLALLQNMTIKRILSECSYSPTQLEEAIRKIRGNKKVTGPVSDSQFDALTKYGTDLTELATSGKLDPVIGREDEVRRVIRVLCRRTKNNPVLIGEPGVGKTAVVECLAQRIVQGDVPASLKGRLISLDMGALISGAKYRGEFEERLKSVLNEIKDSVHGVVLFIDEIHLVMGGGKVDGAMDAANLLKPMLARGELRCIGATTLDEYRKYVEKDSAFERRFQQVHVHEPSVEATISILRGLKDRYAAHHDGVRILDSALIEAAHLSDRYITNRFLPDKAIDLMDEACSSTRVQLESQPEAIDILERHKFQLEVELKVLEKDKSSKEQYKKVQENMAALEEKLKPLKVKYENEKQRISEMRQLTQRITQLKTKLEIAERHGDAVLVAELRYDVLPDKELRLKELQKEQDEYEQNEIPLISDTVGPEQIAEVVSRWTGIPVHKLSQTECARLLNLEVSLKKRVVGQEEAIQAVVRAVLRNGAGLSKKRMPIGSFLFLGPTGVGKTELSNALAEELFDTPERIIRLDMTEYMEQHSVARLIGAPPGYIGHEEGGQLTEEVRRHPYSVILFDEIEKAHSSIWNILLQVLDDGRLTDSQGHTVDFTNTIIILTSNIGAYILLDAAEKLSKNVDTADELYSKAQKRVIAEISQYFKPELINRLDSIVVFQPLQEATLKQLVRLQLEDVFQRLLEKKIKLSLTENAIEHVIKEAYDPAYGARPFRRFIETYIVSELSIQLLSGKLSPNTKVICDWRDDKWNWDIQPFQSWEMSPSYMTDIDVPNVLLRSDRTASLTSSTQSVDHSTLRSQANHKDIRKKQKM